MDRTRSYRNPAALHQPQKLHPTQPLWEPGLPAIAIVPSPPPSQTDHRLSNQRNPMWERVHPRVRQYLHHHHHAEPLIRDNAVLNPNRQRTEWHITELSYKPDSDPRDSPGAPSSTSNPTQLCQFNSTKPSATLKRLPIFATIGNFLHNSAKKVCARGNQSGIQGRKCTGQ